MTNQHTSDVIDRVHHEHSHLTKLFDDINKTFDALVDDNVSGERRLELIESAAEDLAFGLEDMLHHFDQEEEVFFEAIEKRYPEFAPDIAGLVKTHEFLCDQSRWLQSFLKKPLQEVERGIPEARKVIRSIHEAIQVHNVEENQIFTRALKRMNPQERRELLADMERI